MKLITETVEQVEFLTEAAADGGKNYFIEGTFMQADTLNRNKRMYPKHILLNEVNRYTKEFVNNSRAFGELNHPAGPTVNLDRVAIIIKEFNNYVSELDGVTSEPASELIEAAEQLVSLSAPQPTEDELVSILHKLLKDSNKELIIRRRRSCCLW